MSDTQITDKRGAIPSLPLALIDHLPDAVIIVDGDGRITRANPRVATLFGYEPQALLGQPVEVLMPERFQQVHVMQRTGFLARSSIRIMGAGLELYGRRSDGSEFPVDIMLSPIDGPEGKAVLAVVRDLTERLEADRQRQLAARNETLLREIHHRVKNNLQVILSLLSVQSENVRDPAARAAITESESRIRSVSLIHEKLYRSLKLGGSERELGIMLEINLYRASAEARLRQSMAALRVSEARFRTVIDTAQEGILLVDDEGLVQILNPAARRMFGWGDEAIGEAIDRLIASGDQHAAGSFAANLSKFSGVSHEVEGRHKNGTTFPMDLTVGEASQLGHRLFVGIARDISERRQAEKTQRVLIDELNHRVKNTLATVQAFAAQTLSRAKDPVHFLESFTGRIQALASAHALLTRTTWAGAELGTLIRAQLAVGCDVEGDRLVCSGPEVILDPQLAVHLGLALHELCINAVKYGALSIPEGRLTVSWTLVKSETSTELKLDWIESGGPPVAPPASRGFGTVLVEHGLAHIGARVKLGFPATGVICEILLPITERSRPASHDRQDY